jgi:hypothetical protein
MVQIKIPRLQCGIIDLPWGAALLRTPEPVIARSGSDEAIQLSLLRHGLLRFARNDG